MLTNDQIIRMLEIRAESYVDKKPIDEELLQKRFFLDRLDEYVMWSRDSIIVFSSHPDKSEEELLREFKGWNEVELCVNVYSVTREYGGPEEGGWFYDWFEHLEGEFVTGIDYADELQEKCEYEYEKLDEGDISSVNGGVKHVVYVEHKIAQSETTERPMYE